MAFIKNLFKSHDSPAGVPPALPTLPEAPAAPPLFGTAPTTAGSKQKSAAGGAKAANLGIGATFLGGASSNPTNTGQKTLLGQ